VAIDTLFPLICDRTCVQQNTHTPAHISAHQPPHTCTSAHNSAKHTHTHTNTHTSAPPHMHISTQQRKSRTRQHASRAHQPPHTRTCFPRPHTTHTTHVHSHTSAPPHAHLFPTPTIRLSRRRLRPLVMAAAAESASVAPCSKAWPSAACRLKGRSIRSPVNHQTCVGLARTIFTVHGAVCIRKIWQGNHPLYGHIRCICTVLSTTLIMFGSWRSTFIWFNWFIWFIWILLSTSFGQMKQ